MSQAVLSCVLLQNICSHLYCSNFYVAFRCIFYGNSFRLPQQCSVYIAAGVCRVEDCQITSQSGGGMRSLCVWHAVFYLSGVEGI